MHLFAGEARNQQRSLSFSPDSWKSLHRHKTLSFSPLVMKEGELLTNNLFKRADRLN